jgi:uroporphyrinogen decarboxylase
VSRVRETLSPRERVRLALDHQETDRVPISLICGGFEGTTGPKLARHLGLDGEGLDRWLERYVDVAVVGEYRGTGAEYRGPSLGRRADAYEDIWGVWRKAISYGDAAYYEIECYPLAAINDIAGLRDCRWPQADWWDYSLLPDLLARATARRDYALCILSGNPFERTWWMRGYEQTFMDMIERPELFHEIMTRVTDFHIACTRKTLEAAGREVELSFTGDDIAGQRGLIVSLPMWEEHIKPYHQRLNAVIHEYGSKVIYHSDGGVMDAIPGLIDMGIDVLQALQFSADRMDPVVMKEQYGDHLCFEGGISVQTTLPFGSVTDVEDEVRNYIRTLGRGGGYILGPSHAIQSGTPPENVVAMFETAASTPMGG